MKNTEPPLHRYPVCSRSFKAGRVVGCFGVDFISVKENNEWTPGYEINLRGGTTHPF
jgi:hypothetical protein